MDIGIHGRIAPEDHDLIRELGVTWNKVGIAVDYDISNGNEWSPGCIEVAIDERGYVERMADLGLRVVLDVRTDYRSLSTQAAAAFKWLAARGMLESNENPGTHEEAIAICKRHAKATQAVVCEDLKRRVSTVVRIHKDLVADWEFWGEWNCPHTSRGVFDSLLSYPGLLATFGEAVREEAPEARVWTGGNGMDIDNRWIGYILEAGHGAAFDVCNFHPYYKSDFGLADAMSECEREGKRFDRRAWFADALVAQGNMMRRSFAEARAWLQADGNDQPFACTEWGRPHYGPVPEDTRLWAESNVVPNGVPMLFEDEAIAAMNQDLEVMEAAGFEVVIVHTLRDTSASHWGEHCGLIGTDGQKKATFDVVKEWAARA